MSLAARAVQAAREVGAVQQEADSSITLGSARGYLSADDAGLDDLRAGVWPWPRTSARTSSRCAPT